MNAELAMVFRISLSSQENSFTLEISFSKDVMQYNTLLSWEYFEFN